MVKSGALVNILTTPIAPIAQWIERCPPEAKTRVRVAVGVHEPPKVDLGRFLSMILFNTRGKFDDLVEQFLAVLRIDPSSSLLPQK